MASTYSSIGGIFGAKFASILINYITRKQYLFIFSTLNMMLCFCYQFITNRLIHFIIYFFTGLFHNSLYYMINHVGKH
jgi:fucose permease